MPLAQTHQPYAVGHYPTGGSETIVGGINQMGLPVNAEVEREVAAGSIYSQVGSLLSTQLGMGFTTYDLATLFGIVATGGNCVLGVANYGTRFFYQLKNCAGPAATCRTYTAADALWTLGTLSMDHRRNAMCSVNVAPAWDGTNDPIIKADAQALPAITTNHKRFTMNKMRIEVPAGGSNLAFNTRQTASLDFNTTVQRESGDGDTLDTMVAVQSVMPTLRVAGLDATWLDTVSALLGGVKTHAYTDLYLKDRDQAVGAAAHIKLTLHGLAYFENLAEGNVGVASQTRLVIDTFEDQSSNAPIIITTGVAIP